MKRAIISTLGRLSRPATGVGTGAASRWRGLVTLVAASGAVGCSSAASIPDFGQPQLDRIVVFFPVGGLVTGRGLSEAAPAGASHVFIKAHPNGSETIREVESDGSFEFTILALGGNILEVAGATDRSGARRGEPVFITVPDLRFSDRDFICCFTAGQARGTCQTTVERDTQLEEDGVVECPSPQTGRTRCVTDAECGFEEGEWLEIDVQAIDVTPPDERGLVVVSGNAPPTALVTLQNRGFAGIGEPRQQLVLRRLSDEQGRFAFPPIQARGDDELIVQFQDLNGFRSPAASILVPDASLAGIDVVGAFAWQPLRDGAAGTVAIQISPYGIDGRGMCPDHNETPQTCFTGGLLHSMVNLTDVRIDGRPDPITLSPTPLSVDVSANRGYDGNVRAGPLDVILVIDSSASADGKILQNEATVRAVTSFLQGLRQRDRVGAVSFGSQIRRLGVQYDTNGNPIGESLFSGPGRGALDISVQNALRQPGAGDARLFDAISEAAEMLDEANRNVAGIAPAGRIIVITGSEHVGTEEESALAFFEALDDVDTSVDAARPLTQVDMIGVSLARSQKFDDLQSITAFTGGAYFDVSAVQVNQVNQLELALSDIRGTLSGSFLLLYDITIPNGVGKAALLEFDAEMIGVQQVVQYSGLLRVDLAAN